MIRIVSSDDNPDYKVPWLLFVLIVPIAETNLFTVWMYRCDAICDLKRDMEETLEKCIPVTKEMLKTSLLQRFICAVVRIFAPML